MILTAGSRASAASWKRHWSLPFAGGAVGVGVGPDFAGDLQADLGNQRPGDRRAQQIDAFVLGLPLQHGKGEIAAKLLAGVDDAGRLGPDVAGLLQDGLAVFAGLPQVDVHAVDVVALVHQPAQNDGGIQPAGIRQNAARHASKSSIQPFLLNRELHNNDAKKCAATQEQRHQGRPPVQGRTAAVPDYLDRIGAAPVRDAERTSGNKDELAGRIQTAGAMSSSFTPKARANALYRESVKLLLTDAFGTMPSNP